MTSEVGLGIPLQPQPSAAEVDSEMRSSGRSSSSSPSSMVNGINGAASEKTTQVLQPIGGRGRQATETAGIPVVKTTRTRTVKSRAIFSPEDDAAKKRRNRGPGRPRSAPKLYPEVPLRNLLEDEDAEDVDAKAAGKAAGKGGVSVGEGQRKRSRNASDGENRWDRIRTKFRLLLNKVRKDKHFLQVYQQDGWKNSGREKFKPTSDLEKAKERVRGVQVELREVVKRLTEMNPGGARWRGLEVDKEGLIEVAGVVCTKCGRGDSDDSDDILLCDHAGCFRAYHQNCLAPPIKPDAFPSEEEDWFCWQCECLLDCLEMLEDEFQDQKFDSWEDVFPEVDAGADGGSAQGSVQEGLPLAGTDESEDDESFKGSSSGEEEEEEENGDDEEDDDDEDENEKEKDGGGGDALSYGADGTGDAADRGRGESYGSPSEDEDLQFMSDAESVASDEVDKLRKEAHDIAQELEGECRAAGKGGEDEASAGEGDRGRRARDRRKRRAVALGIKRDDDVEAKEDETDDKRKMLVALSGDGALDTANILDGRRRRTNVDYVKLNEDLFGGDYCEDLDGDGDGDGDGEADGDGDRDRDMAVSSDGEYSVSWDLPLPDDPPPRRKSKTPRRKGTPSIDPFTGQPRKRGRPRLYPEGYRRTQRHRERTDAIDAISAATTAPAATTVTTCGGGDGALPPPACSDADVILKALSRESSSGDVKPSTSARSVLSNGALPKVEMENTLSKPNTAGDTSGLKHAEANGSTSSTANGTSSAVSSASSDGVDGSEFAPFMGLKRRRGRPRKYPVEGGVK